MEIIYKKVITNLSVNALSKKRLNVGSKDGNLQNDALMVNLEMTQYHAVNVDLLQHVTYILILRIPRLLF